MKKLIYTPILITIVLFCLQGLWLNKIHHAYMKQSMQTIQQLLSLSIAKESSLRNYSLPQNPKNPRIIYRHANQITEEERKQLKGDTINLNSLVSRNISNNMAEAILQLQQDGLIKKKSFIQLTKLDSIFRQELNTANINISHQILLYDKDTIVKQSIGALPTNALFIKKTQLYPIGTKGLQFIQVKANVPFSSFIQEMLQILIESILLTIIILGYVIFLVITIHKKDKLFKRREASVNGTIHDLKSPLNSIITLMSFIKKKVPDIHTQQLVENTERQAQKLVNEIEALLITAIPETENEQKDIENERKNLNKLDQEFLDKVTGIIEENLSIEKMDVAFIADKMCMSHSTLYRKIKGLTEMSVNEFVRKIKMKKSIELINSENYSLAEISDLTGFSSIAYFRQCFKDEYGMAPTEYLKKKRK